MTTQENSPSRLDKELECPETVFVQDIEDRVFQSIVLQTLSHLNGISLIEGSFIDHLFGRSNEERVHGIHIEQSNKNQAVNVRLEVNVHHGTSIPDKVQEIQSVVSEKITEITGLHVASVHVIVKNMVPPPKVHLPQENLEERMTHENVD